MLCRRLSDLVSSSVERFDVCVQPFCGSAGAAADRLAGLVAGVEGIPQLSLWSIADQAGSDCPLMVWMSCSSQPGMKRSPPPN